ncbi:MAG: hypothetical protein NC320_04120 [Clostridium sp.]|nr:hypothetical protein [Clostridium sp.]MCM1547252.1 hypothetical protein [Ruminococcus sp.]
MKNSIKKIFAGLSAAAMLVSAMPIVSAFAEDVIVEAKFNTREVEDGVVITKYTGEAADEIEIPAEYEGKTVVGVDSYAFSVVSQDVNFVVPATLTLDNMGNEAFVTAEVINKGIIEASGADTLNGVIKYWANDVAKMNATDAQISEAIKNAYAHVVDAPMADTLVETAVLVIQDIQAGKYGFSQANINKLGLALAAIPYPGVTMEGPADADAEKYAAAKNIPYTAKAKYAQGDINMSGGKPDLYDAILMAEIMAGKKEATPEQIAVGDLTGDGKIGLYDAIAVAEIMAGKRDWQ